MSQDSQLPTFARSMGVDVIVTHEGKAILVELQHGFGRRGLLRLYPQASRWYRKRFRTLIRERGSSLELRKGLRKYCSDKIRTYRFFAEYQPSSFAYREWDASVEDWLDRSEAPLIFSKPPDGSCGRGIQVFEPETLRRLGSDAKLPNPTLLQEFVESRHIDAEDGPHLACIRHIVMMVSDGEEVRLTHLPPYWRVAPIPYFGPRELGTGDAVTANVSRGASAVAVSAEDAAIARALVEEILPKLLALALDRDSVPMGSSTIVSGEGTEDSAA